MSSKQSDFKSLFTIVNEEIFIQCRFVEITNVQGMDAQSLKGVDIRKVELKEGQYGEYYESTKRGVWIPANLLDNLISALEQDSSIPQTLVTDGKKVYAVENTYFEKNHKRYTKIAKCFYNDEHVLCHTKKQLSIYTSQVESLLGTLRELREKMTPSDLSVNKIIDIIIDKSETKAKKKDIKKLIDQKHKDLEGYVTKEAAARLVAKDLKINLSD